MSILSKLPCKVISTVTQQEDEQAWLAARSRGIGGSEIGAICGVNKYSSPLLVYLKKAQGYEPEFSEASKERMHFGHLLEPIVAQEFEARTGQRVAECPATLQHKNYDYMLANIDRFIIDEDGNPVGVLECKTSDARLLKDWEEGEFPRSYYYQLQWYLLITGLKYGAIACLVGGNRFIYYEVWADDDLQEEMVCTAVHFWNEHVQKLVEPAISGNDADSEYLKKQHPEAVDKKEVSYTDGDIDALASEIVEFKRDIKDLEEALEEKINRFKALMGDAEIANTINHTVKWSNRKQKRVNTEMLKVEYPHIYKAVEKQIEFRVFTVK